MILSVYHASLAGSRITVSLTSNMHLQSIALRLLAIEWVSDHNTASLGIVILRETAILHPFPLFLLLQFQTLSLISHGK